MPNPVTDPIGAYWVDGSTGGTALSAADLNARELALRKASASILTYTIPGALEMGPRTTPLVIPRAGTITAAVAACATPPSGGQVVVDINKNGTTIFTTQANRPKVLAGAQAGAVAVPDVQSVVAGDLITVDIDQIGSVVPQVVAVTDAGSGSASKLFTIPAPAAAGDLLVYTAFAFYDGGGPATITPPAGWTEIGTTLDTGSFSVQRFWAVWNGSSTYTFTASGSLAQYANGRILAIRNALVSNPIDGFTGSAQGFVTDAVLPSLTPTVGAELYLATVNFQDAMSVVVPPADCVLAMAPGGAGSTDSYWAWYRNLTDASVPSGTRTVTFSSEAVREASAYTVRPDTSGSGGERGTTLTLSIGME